MKHVLRDLARRVVPRPLARRFRGSDSNEAWEFKRRFFWNAFKALDFNGISGDYVEFGSHGGMTFCLAYDQIRRRSIRRHLWAFDSFRGLPAGDGERDRHPKWIEGAMSTDEDAFHRLCRAHGIPRDAFSVVPGFYDETLPRLADDAPPADIALAYVDCDLYSSTKTVLEFLAPRLKHGMILAFDDYFCWSADQISGERSALLDVLTGDARWNLVRYRDYGWAGASFVVERAELVRGRARQESVSRRADPLRDGP